MNTQRSHISSALLLLLVLSLSTLLGLAPALAAPLGLASTTARGEVFMKSDADTYGPGIWHNAKEGKTWYGSYRTFPSISAYCIDAGKQSPLPKYFKGSTPKTITTAQTAWALHTYSGSKSADTQAALSALSRLDKAIPHDHTVPPRKPADLGKKFAGAAKQFDSITADAKKFAGPYTLDVSLSPILKMPSLDPHDNANDGSQDSNAGKSKDKPVYKSARVPPQRTDQVSLKVELKSASGALVPNIPITLKTTGVKKAPASIISGNKPSIAQLDLAAPGKVTVEASATVAPTSVLLYSPKKAKKVQRVITADKPVPVKDKASLNMKSQPTVTTEISDATPKPGATITDSFTVSGLVGDHKVTVDHQLWRTASKPTLGKKNDDAEVIAKVTSKGVGNGTHRSPQITVPKDFTGWLYFTETIAGDDKTDEWKGIHGQPKETGFVPWRPSAETRATLDGNKAHDEVTVTGMRPGSEVEVIVSAYRSDTKPEQSPKVQGTKINTQDFTVVADQEGKATITTEPIEVPVGWVTFVASVTKNDQHEGWVSDWGIPAETVHRAPEEPPKPPEPSEPPAPPEQPTVPPEQPTPPPEQPTPPTKPVADQPVAEKPQAPNAPGQLPRTGASGQSMLIGAGIVLLGLGAAALALTQRRREE